MKKKPSKVLGIIMMICGFVVFIIQFMILRNQNLGEIRFSDLYQFVISIFLLGFGSYTYKKATTEQN